MGVGRLSQPNNGVIKCTVHKGRDREKGTQKLHFELQDLLEETGGVSRGRGWWGQKVLFCIYPGVLDTNIKKNMKNVRIYMARTAKGEVRDKKEAPPPNSVPHTLESYLKEKESQKFSCSYSGKLLQTRGDQFFFIPHALESYLNQEETKNYIPHALESYLKQEETKKLIPHSLGSYLKQEETKHSVPHTLQGSLKEKET